MTAQTQPTLPLDLFFADPPPTPASFPDPATFEALADLRDKQQHRADIRNPFDPLEPLRETLALEIFTHTHLARLWKPINAETARGHGTAAQLARRLQSLLPKPDTWPAPFDGDLLRNAAAFTLLRNLLNTADGGLVVLRQHPAGDYSLRQPREEPKAGPRFPTLEETIEASFFDGGPNR